MSRWKKINDQTQEDSYDTSRKTENFVTNNVRLITFLVCIGVFLVICGPIMVMEAVDYFSDEDVRPRMTRSNVISLSDQKGDIPVSQITNFACREERDDNNPQYVYYYFEIEPNYLMLAVGNKNTAMLEYCQLYNLDTGDAVDVLSENVRAFLENPKEK